MPGKFLSKLRALFFGNKRQKFIALLLAVISWYAIREVISNQRWVLNIPLEIQLDEGLAVLDRSASSVDVLFQGSQTEVQALEREYIKVLINNRGKPVEEASRIAIEPKHVEALGGARPVQVRPAHILLTLDEEGERQVPVKANIDGALPEGHEIEKLVCTPATVTVYGPRQRLRDIETVQTEPIDLRGRVRSFELRMPVVPPSDRWTARIEPASVSVEVVLAERSATRDFKDVKMKALISPDLAPKVDILPARVDVVLGGRSDLVERVEKSDVAAYVDCTGLDASATYELPVRVHTKSGLKVESITPKVVQVEIDEL